MSTDLTDEERKAIAALRRLASRWPSSLWLFTNGVGINVMKYSEGKERAVTESGGMDPAYSVAVIHGIDSDGGDW